MSRGAALTGALLATLATPATWPLALAAFLLRGGILLVLLPIVVLPSPVGLGNLLAPTVMTVVFGGVSVAIVAIVGTIVLGVVAWIVLGGLAAASFESEAARMVVAGGDGSGIGAAVANPPTGVGGRVAVRILVVRLLAHVPTAIAVGWGSARLIAVTYRELTSPFDVATPIVLRVLRGAPEVIAIVAALVTLGEILGGIAARNISLGGADVRRSLRDALAAMARRPIAVLIDFLVPAIVLGLVLVPSTVAVAAAWANVRQAMASMTDPVAPILAVLLFVAVWGMELVVISVATAWRGAVWSLASFNIRQRPAGSSVPEAG